MNPVPVLETERLILRPHELTDLDDYTAILSDADVMRFITGRALSREETWNICLRHRGMWAVMGFGFFAVVEKSSGVLVGEAGVQERKRDIEPPLEGTLEAGWIFSARTQGNGYAREAMGAVLDWCDEAYPGKPLTCIINAENARSVTLAEKLGFRTQAPAVYHDEKVIVFRRD